MLWARRAVMNFRDERTLGDFKVFLAGFSVLIYGEFDRKLWLRRPAVAIGLKLTGDMNSKGWRFIWVFS